MSQHNPACFARHIGTWLMEPQFLSRSVDAIRSGLWRQSEARAPDLLAGKVVFDPASRGEIPDVLYTVTNDGIAIVTLEGPLMKFDSKYGGTNTLRTRRAVRMIMQDEDVKATMIYADTPGGHVSGTMELADDLRALGKIMPVHLHADDLLASAGYWVASATGRISMNPIGQAGSIGVVAVVEDTSKAAEANGVTVHVISTGKHKGSFADGAPITEEHLAELQATVDGINAFFLAAVSKGRGISAAKLEKIADGRVFFAEEAKSLGLIDAVEPFEASMKELQRAAKSFVSPARQKTQARTRAQMTLDLEMDAD